MNIQCLKDSDLLEHTKALVQEERNCFANLIRHLGEIAKRRLYSDLGYSSLRAYLIGEFHYSPDEADRRAMAARVFCGLGSEENCSQVAEKLECGALNLTHFGLAQRVLQQKQKEGKRLSTMEVLNKFSGTTKNQAIDIAVELAPELAKESRDFVREVGTGKLEFTFTAEEGLREKLEELRGRLAHKYPSLKLGELVGIACEYAINSLSAAEESPKAPKAANRSVPARKLTSAGDATKNSSQLRPSVPARAPTQATRPFTPATQNIPRAVRREVWRRDKGECQKCHGKFAVEVHHSHPRALGGPNTLENLSLLCRSCNLREGIRTYGLNKMQSSSQPPAQ